MEEVLFAALPAREQEDVIDDWGIAVEVDCLFQEDPLTRALGELQSRLPVRRWTVEPLSRPPITAMSFTERMRQAWDARQIGAKCTLETGDKGTVIEQVWLANCPLVNVDSIARDLAHLKALQRLETLREGSSS